MRLSRGELALAVGLAVWAFAPLAAVGIHVAVNGGELIGTNGYDPFDQFQYLAWIRDEGSHLFGSDLWVIGGTSHDYVQPMYLISGLLWRAGVGIQVAYLIWKPVALVVLFVGFAAYARRMTSGRRPAIAALALALFYETPVLAFAYWTGHLSGTDRLRLAFVSDDPNSALNLWGFEHAAIAIGLMPVFLVAVERLWAVDRAGGRSDRRWSAVAAVSGALIAWLHPWQAAEILGVIAVVWLLSPSRRRLLVVIVPVVATVLPLAYGVLLAHYDPWWSSFQTQSTVTPPGPLWAVVASFGPLVFFALAGIRRPRGDGEWMLVLWPLAAAAAYLLLPQFPSHSLSGVTLPLAILAVRGWQRCSARVPVPAPVAAGLATAAVLAVTVPALVRNADGVADDLAPNLAGALVSQELRLTADQASAERYLSADPRPGGVLAPWLVSMSIPGMTGRTVFAGHPQWQPHQNVPLTGEFFAAGTSGPVRRAILRGSKATFVLADCGAPPRLQAQLAPLASLVRRFGCVTLYAIR